MNHQGNGPSRAQSFRNVVRSQDIDDIKAALQNWIDVMKTNIPEDVVALYADDATFWGTMASTLSTDKVGIQSYFVDFLQKDNLDIDVVDGTIQLSGDGSEAIYAGSYNFSFTDDDNMAVMIPARFTFIFGKQDDGAWMIKHHHSSAMPVKQTPQISPKNE